MLVLFNWHIFCSSL